MRQVEFEVTLQPGIDGQHRHGVTGLGDGGLERRHDGGQNGAVRHCPDVLSQGVAEQLAQLHAVFVRSALRIGAEPDLGDPLSIGLEQPGDGVGIANVEQQPVFSQWTAPSDAP